MNKRLMKLQNIMEANRRLNNEIINEQHQPSNFKEGEMVKVKRDVDGQIYTIKIVKSEPNYMLGIVTGPGTYKNQSLKDGANLELYSDSPGIISGNTQLGKFTVVK